MATIFFLVLAAVVFLALGMRKAPMWVWAAVMGLLTYIWQSGVLSGEASASGILSWIAWLPFVAVAALAVPSLRRRFIIAPAFAMVQRILPKVSDTEAQALDAGTVGFDAELFPARRTGPNCKPFRRSS